MPIQHAEEVPIGIGDRVVLEQVKRAVDELDIKEATQQAMALRMVPPTDNPQWMLCQRFEPDGSEGPLIWVLVTETE